MKIELTKKQKAILTDIVDPMEYYLNEELKEDDPDTWNGPYTMPVIKGHAIDLNNCEECVISDLIDRLNTYIFHSKADAGLYMIDDTKGDRVAVQNLLNKMAAMPQKG